MLLNFSKKKHSVDGEVAEPVVHPTRRWAYLAGLPVWVLVSFVVAELAVSGALLGLAKLNVRFVGVDDTILNTIFSIIVYALTLTIVIGIPFWVKKIHTTRAELGLARLPFWTDLLLAPAGFIIYAVVSAILSNLAAAWLSGYDASSTQNTGFSDLHTHLEYVLAFFTLVVLAPVAEETLFRGYLFGKLKKHVPAWAAVIVVSLLFGALHISFSGSHAVYNVAIDTFALSLMLCILRQVSGSIWPSILLHMTKNGIAYYLLFINGVFLPTIGS